MNWSSENLMRGRVLRDWDVDLTDSRVTRADLGTVSARSARGIVVQPRARSSRPARRATRPGSKRATPPGYTHGIDDARPPRRARSASSCSGSAARPTRFAAREATARADIEDQVVAAAMQIAEVLVGHELAQPDERGRDAIARALALAPVHGDVTARLHPADIARAGRSGRRSRPGRVLAIVPDPSLTPGDCIVDVAACRIDAAHRRRASNAAREVLVVSALLEHVLDAARPRVQGRVARVVGLNLEIDGLQLPIGASVRVARRGRST